jgi:radical SAM protein with 4Fe4S-binding SPASM domain
MTTTLNSLPRAREIIDEYLVQGFSSIFLRWLSPYGFATKTHAFDKYRAGHWLDFYFEGLEYVLKLNRAGVPFREEYASIILRKLLTPFPSPYVDLQSPAGIGISAIAFNYDGYVYASDESRMLAEMGDTSFQLGHLLRDSYRKIMTSPRLMEPLEESMVEGAPMCSECAFQQYCGADPVYHHATQGDSVGHKLFSDHCRRTMSIVRRLMIIFEDRPEDAEILRSWAY